MTGEELAKEVVTDFEKRGREMVERLREAHHNDYENFLGNVERAKEKLRVTSKESQGQIDEAIAKYRDSMRLADVLKHNDDSYGKLTGNIATVLAKCKSERI